MTITRPPTAGDRSLHSGADGQSHADAHTEIADAFAGIGYTFDGVMDGTTDDAAALQTALNAGGEVVVPSNKVVAIASTVNLKTDSELTLMPGARIKWTGSAGGTMFSNPIADPVQRADVAGGVFDCNSLADRVFDLHSPQKCRIEHFEVRGGRATTSAVRVQADATNASGYNSTRNAVRNRIGDIKVSGACAYIVELSGQGSATGVVTLNEFYDLEGDDVRTAAYRFVQWCDSNRIVGNNRAKLTANNAAGIVFQDTGTPTTDVGVYNNRVDAALDTFTGGGLTGRVALKINKSRQNEVWLYNDPPAEGGAIVVDSSVDSYIVHQSGINTGVTKILTTSKNWDVTGMRLPNNTAILARNAADSADFNAIGMDTGNNLNLYGTLGAARVRITNSNNVVIGSTALATSATAGFLHIPTCAGAPTGVPTQVNAGVVPIVMDTTNKKLWYYDWGAAAWKGIVLA